MAQAKQAVLVRADQLSNDTRILSFRAESQLDFQGGQYIIVDTGVPLPGDKIAKRAYSIISSDQRQEKFQLAVKRLGIGPGSNFMHRLEIGNELKFSGPWGKLVAAEDSTAALAFATDTGITAALGLMNGRGMAPLRRKSKLIWMRESDSYFLPMDFITAHLGEVAMRNLAVRELSPVNSPARAPHAAECLKQAVRDLNPRWAFLAGDGAVIYPLRDRLIEAGLAAEQIRLECFFNNPERKVPAQSQGSQKTE